LYLNPMASAVEKWSRLWGDDKTPLPPWDSACPASALVTTLSTLRLGGAGDLAPLVNQEAQAALQAVVTQEKVRAVELGCGSGEASVFMAKCGLDVTAVDLIPAALERARQAASREGVEVNWVCGDAFEFTAPAFDFMFDLQCWHVLREVDEPRVVAKMGELLRPGGVVLMLVGSDEEERDNLGPPKVAESAIRSAFAGGGPFEILSIVPSVFDVSAVYGKDPPKCWVVVLKRV